MGRLGGRDGAAAGTFGSGMGTSGDGRATRRGRRTLLPRARRGAHRAHATNRASPLCSLDRAPAGMPSSTPPTRHARARRARRAPQRRQEHAAQRAAGRAHRDHQPPSADDAGARPGGPDGGRRRSTCSSTPGRCTRAQTRLGRRMNEQARRRGREADVVVLVVGRAPTSEGSGARPAIARAELPGHAARCSSSTKIDRLKDKALLLPLIDGLRRRATFRRDRADERPPRQRAWTRLLAELRSCCPSSRSSSSPTPCPTSPMRFFVAEFVREQILAQTGRRSPRRRGRGRALRRDGKVTHIEHRHARRARDAQGDPHRRGRRCSRRSGRRARARVEQMLGRRCTCNSWVRGDPRLDERRRQARASSGTGTQGEGHMTKHHPLARPRPPARRLDADAHGGHRRPAQRRQVDALQPAGARPHRNRPRRAGRHARPPVRRHERVRAERTRWSTRAGFDPEDEDP